MMATFVQRGEAVDFTPSRNVAAGDVLMFAGVAGIVKIPVRAGELGALHLSGVYDVAKGTDSLAAGDKVYWNHLTEQATADAENHVFLGVASAHAPAASAKVRVILNFGHPDSGGGASSEGIQWQSTTP